MNKPQLIDAIHHINRTADLDYLDHFSEQELAGYLQRLTTLRGRRGRASVWVRDPSRPAIVVRMKPARHG